MKIFTAVLFISLSLFMPLLHAQEKEKIYAGVGFLRNNLSYATINNVKYSDIYKTTLEGLHLFVGQRGTHTGFEAGLALASAGNVNTKNINTISATLDALFYLPINTEKTLELIGIIGFSWNSIEAKVGGDASHSQSFKEINHSKIRFGAGIQYEIIEDLSFRSTITSGIKIFGDEFSFSIDKNSNYVPASFAASAGLLYSF